AGCSSSASAIRALRWEGFMIKAIGRALTAAIFALFVASAASAAGVKQGHHGHGHDKSIPSASRSGIDHIVVVMMENRSFDHLLGWLPNADGMQEGLS